MQTHQDLIMSEKQAALKAQAEAAFSRQLYLIYKEHLQITPCEANDQAIISYFNGDEITLLEFNRSYQNDPSLRNRLAHRTLQQASKQENKQRAELVDEIILLMVVSPESAPSVRKDLEGKSIEQLQARLADIKAKQSMSKDQARELLQADAQQRRDQLNEKPSFLGLDYSADDLKRMPAKELRALCKKFGDQAINDRLSGADSEAQRDFLKRGF